MGQSENTTSSMVSTPSSPQDNGTLYLQLLEESTGVRWYRDSQIVLTMLYIFVAIPGSAGNLLTFTTIISSKISPCSDALSTVTYDMMASLAISDFINGFFYATIGLAAIFEDRDATWWRDDTYGDILNAAWFCTQFHLDLIAVNRFISVFYAHKYNAWFSKKKCTMYVTVCWLLAFIIYVPHVYQEICFVYVDEAETFLYDYTCPWTDNWTKIESYFITPGSMLLIVACYIAIIIKIRKQSRLVHAQGTNGHSVVTVKSVAVEPISNARTLGTHGTDGQAVVTVRRKAQSSSSRDLAVTIQFAIVFAAYAVGETLFLTVNWLLVAGVTGLPHVLDILITVGFVTHFSINPLVYFSRNPHMRKQARWMLARTCRRGVTRQDMSDHARSTHAPPRSTVHHQHHG